MVQAIDTHLPVHMNEVVVRQNDAHVVDFAFFVIEEGQVSRFALFNKTQGFSQLGLVLDLSGQRVTAKLVDHLGQSRGIYPKRGLAPGLFRGVEVEQGHIDQGRLLLRRIQSLAFVRSLKGPEVVDARSQKNRGEALAIALYMRYQLAAVLALTSCALGVFFFAEFVALRSGDPSAFAIVCEFNAYPKLPLFFDFEMFSKEDLRPNGSLGVWIFPQGNSAQQSKTIPFLTRCQLSADSFNDQGRCSTTTVADGCGAQFGSLLLQDVQEGHNDPRS